MAGIATLRSVKQYYISSTKCPLPICTSTYCAYFHASLILPLATKAADLDGNPWLVYIIRALMGVCEGKGTFTLSNVCKFNVQTKLLLIAGTTFPSVSAMMAKWAPQSERTRMSTVIYAGKTLVASFTLSTLSISLNFRVTSWHNYCLPIIGFHFRQARMVMGILHSRNSMFGLGLYMDGICVRQSRH